MTTPTVTKISSSAGIAGQLSYVATVDYGPENGGESVVQFVGNRHGGPVVMILSGGLQVFVDRDVNERCGRLSPRWVRRFFGEEA